MALTGNAQNHCQFVIDIFLCCNHIMYSVGSLSSEIVTDHLDVFDLPRCGATFVSVLVSRDNGSRSKGLQPGNHMADTR